MYCNCLLLSSFWRCHIGIEDEFYSPEREGSGTNSRPNSRTASSATSKVDRPSSEEVTGRSRNTAPKSDTNFYDVL